MMDSTTKNKPRRSSLLNVHNISQLPEFCDFEIELKKMDRDGDGELQADELINFMVDHAKKKQLKKNLTISLIIILIVGVIVLLANFGLTVTAIWLAKDLRVLGTNLVTPQKELLYAGEAKEMVDFTTGQDMHYYIALDTVRFTRNNKRYRFTINAVNASSLANIVHMTTVAGQVLTVDLNENTLSSEGQVLISSSDRRLFPKSGGDDGSCFCDECCCGDSCGLSLSSEDSFSSEDSEDD
mmetsp:Transcript_992/g.1414  ORF Transcript_992/g.1414 Transcript_992/m.1414 type:complete len:240 (-) Transcript_992:507-1226(-)